MFAFVWFALTLQRGPLAQNLLLLSARGDFGTLCVYGLEFKAKRGLDTEPTFLPFWRGAFEQNFGSFWLQFWELASWRGAHGSSF